ALEAHGAAELLGLAAGEARHRHRDAEELLLEERHAERARQDGLERGVRVAHWLAPGAALQVRVHHLPDDRPRADDRHLDDEIIEPFGPHARKSRHLRAALDLED